MKKLKINNFTKIKLENPKFAKPVRLNYIQNNKQKTWEAVEAHESVAILLYHTTKNAFLLVKQFRPPVYLFDNNYKFTYELCAGIVDKDLDLIQIAREEILEECGYNVKIENISKITSFFTNVGISGAKQHLFYSEIDESVKVNEGGGIDDEAIVLEFVPINVAKKLIYDESKAKTPGLMFAFYWFFEQHQS